MAENTGTLEPGYQPRSSNQSTTAQKAMGQAAGAASAVKEKVSTLTHQAADQIDASRRPTADKIENAAAALHRTAHHLPGGDTVHNAAHSAAGKLESTAGYLRAHDTTDMLTDIELLVKRNPGVALGVAAGLGFFVGWAFRKR